MRAGLRIPSPPPLPTPLSLSSTAPIAKAPAREPLPSASGAPATARAQRRISSRPPPQAPTPRRHDSAPSLLRTQVGLGVVKLDAQGAPLPDQGDAPRMRFIVTPGERPGQLVLTAVSDATRVESDTLVVSLAADGPIDAKRLARAIIGLG